MALPECLVEYFADVWQRRTGHWRA